MRPRDQLPLHLLIMRDLGEPATLSRSLTHVFQGIVIRHPLPHDERPARVSARAGLGFTRTNNR